MDAVGRIGKRRERPHRPDELGARIIWHGRWAGADLRPWKGGRVTLRDPKAKGWPEQGEKTDDIEVARKWAAFYVEHLKDRKRRRHLGIPDAKLLGPMLDEWFRQRQDKADATLQSNQSVMKRLKQWAGENTPIERIQGRREGPREAGDTGLYLQDYFDALRDAGYAATTIKTERAIISGFFNWARHPIVRETKVREPEERDIFTWSDPQLVKIRKAADRIDEIRRVPFPPARLAIELALATGARQSELFGLRWEDLDEAKSGIRIWRQRTRLSRGFKELKGKENRTALVLPSLWDYLDSLPEWRTYTGLILPEETGQPVRYATTVYLVQRVLDTANLNDVKRGWHDFRRTYGRKFLELTEGSGLHLLQVYLGHKDLKTTQKSYGHLSSDHAVNIGRDLVRGKGLKLVR